MSASAKKKLRKEQNAAQLTEKQLAEQKEAKKLKLYTTIFVVAIIVVLVASLVIGGVSYYKNSGIAEKNTVAAVVNDREFNSVELSYYYIDLVNSNFTTWSNTYGDSLEMYMNFMGLDINKPLDEQEYMEGTTWADYFIEMALTNAKSDYLLCQKAEAEGFTLPEDMQAELDASLEQLPTYVAIYGYPNIDSYLVAYYGHGATEESYRAYRETTMLANAYYNAYAENMVIDDAAVRAYEAENFDAFSSFTYATYRLTYTDYLTGGTTDEDGNTIYSEAEKEAARAAAKAAAESLSGITDEDSFNSAIAALPVNADKDVKCTVFEDSLYSTVSGVARDFLADSNRAVGDFTVLPSETTVTAEDGQQQTVVNDYYAVLFLGRNDNLMPLANIRHILVNFTGGTTDENGNTVYTDEEKATAMGQAQAILDEFLAGDATEESFAALATEKTQDYASAATGGLYEDITPEQGIYVESFTNWSVDPVRETGDTGIIESPYGYHIMYYVGDDELSYRDHMITEQIRSENLAVWYNEILATGTETLGDTSRMMTGIVLAG